MEVEQVEAKHFKRGDYIVIDDAPCRVTDNAKSAPGKHGHLKCKIAAVGIIDGKTRMEFKPGDAKLGSPRIDKRDAQVLAVSGNTATVMDTETFEQFDAGIPEEMQGKVADGSTVEYWNIGGVIKAIMATK